LSGIVAIRSVLAQTDSEQNIAAIHIVTLFIEFSLPLI